jgi:hypothetical protein
MQIRELADDLSEMTVAYDEPVPAGPVRRPRRTRRTGMSFIMVDTRSLADLELLASESRVLNMMLAHMDRETNEVRMTTQLLAERTDMLPPAVSRALRDLANRHVITKLGPGLWRVTRWLAYIGDWKDWDVAAKDDPEPQWKR